MPLQPQMSCVRGDLLSDLLPLCGEGGLSEQQRRELCSLSSWSLPGLQPAKLLLLLLLEKCYLTNWLLTSLIAGLIPGSAP